MDLSARPYRGFLAIVDKGTFRAAAATLNTTQPALSASIKELERQLGFALFERLGRRVTLTNKGQRFVDHARRLVLETEWIERAAKEIRADALRIGTAHHIQMIATRNAVIDQFISQHPSQALLVTNHYQSRLAEKLANRTIDVAIGLEPKFGGEVAHLEAEQTGHFEKLCIEVRQACLYLPEEDPLAACDEINPRQLSGRQVLSLARPSGIFLSEVAARWLKTLGADRARAPEGDAASVMRYAALSRMPAVDIGYFPFPDIPAAKTMVRRPVAGEPFLVALVALREDRPMLPPVERFWTMLERNVRSGPGSAIGP